METGLTPREIQVKVRAGASVQEVAEFTQIAPERVEAFAAPVLAERDHIAGQARNASLRQQGTPVAHQTLGDVLAQRLAERGADPESIAWDSFKMDDGRWAVSAEYRIQDAHRHAVFYYDVRGRFAVAGNDEAQWVSGERSVGPSPGGGSPAGADASDDEPTVRLVAAEDELALIRAVETDEDTNHQVSTPNDESGADPYQQNRQPHDKTAGPQSRRSERDRTESDLGPSAEREPKAGPQLVGEPTHPDSASAAATSAPVTEPEESESARTDTAQTESSAADSSTTDTPSFADGADAGNRTNSDNSTDADDSTDTADSVPSSDASQLDLLYGMLGDGSTEERAAGHVGITDAAAVPEAPAAPDFAETTWEQPTDYPAEPEPEPEQPDLFTTAPAPTTAGPTESGTAESTPTESSTTESGDDHTDTAALAPAGNDADAPDEHSNGKPSESGSESATASESTPAKSASKSKKRKRASVPSWDEIMFGSPKQE